MTSTTVRPSGAAELLATIAMTHGDGDEWGTNMGWYFAIAHVLWHCTAEPVPPAWEYRHSDACRGIDPDDYEESMILDQFPSLRNFWPNGPEKFREAEDALLYVGTIVSRYDDWCRLAGLNY